LTQKNDESLDRRPLTMEIKFTLNQVNEWAVRAAKISANKQNLTKTTYFLPD
jgi:hypothetical protein